MGIVVLLAAAAVVPLGYIVARIRVDRLQAPAGRQVAPARPVDPVDAHFAQLAGVIAGPCREVSR